MSKTGNKAFTLVEVMAATSILALGIVFIYEAFFISLDSFNYCSSYLSMMPWADELIWQAKDDINTSGSVTSTGTSGVVTNRNNKFNWILSSVPVEGTPDLRKVDLVVSWKIGKKTYRLSRSAYAVYYEE